MISKQIVNLVGLELHVFGLEEYKKLPEDTPLCAMFFSTAIQTTQEYVEDSCRQICTLNNKRRANDRYLIMISLDHPNTGTRKLYSDPPIHNPKDSDASIMNKVYVHAKTTAHNISTIIECFDIHVFGEDSNISVKKWGVVGISMGGLTASIAASIDPKVEVVVMMASSLRYRLWMKHISVLLGLDKDYATMTRSAKMIDEGLKDIYNGVSNAKILMLYGDQDKRTNFLEEEKSIEDLRRAHKSREGVDWKTMVLPVKGHKVSSVYNIEAMKWIHKWSISRYQFLESRI